MVYSPYENGRWVVWGVAENRGCTLTAGREPVFGTLGNIALDRFKLGGIGKALDWCQVVLFRPKVVLLRPKTYWRTD